MNKLIITMMILSQFISLCHVGFADLKSVEKEMKTINDPSQVKCQIMMNPNLNMRHKIILLQMIHQRPNMDTKKVYSKMDAQKPSCNKLTCPKPEKWLKTENCYKMKKEMFINAGNAVARAMGFPVVEPVFNLVGAHVVGIKAYGDDLNGQQQDVSRLWFGWGGITRWYQ